MEGEAALELESLFFKYIPTVAQNITGIYGIIVHIIPEVVTSIRLFVYCLLYRLADRSE